MTDEEKAAFKAKMAEAKSKKTPAARASAGTSAGTVTRNGRTQRETDLEKRLSFLEDENTSLKTSKSELEKFIEKISKPSRKSSAPISVKSSAADDGGWGNFAANPW